MDILKKLFGWAMYKGIDPTRPNLPDGNTKPGNEKPWYRIEAFTIERSRWGQLQDIRWYGWPRAIYNIGLYTIFFHAAIIFFRNVLNANSSETLTWAFALMVVCAWFMLFWNYYKGWVQDNTYVYNKARTRIIKNDEKNIRFSVYRDYHLRDFLIKMIYPIIFVIIDFIAHNGVPHVI